MDALDVLLGCVAEVQDPECRGVVDAHFGALLLTLQYQETLDHDPEQHRVHADRQDQGGEGGLTIAQGLAQFLGGDPQRGVEACLTCQGKKGVVVGWSACRDG